VVGYVYLIGTPDLVAFSCLRLEPFVEIPNAQDLASPNPAVMFVDVNLSESH